MSGLAHYYSKAKGGLMNINPREATQLMEDWAIAGGTGLLLGLTAAATGGMDTKIAGFTVPKDGMASVALGLMGLSMRSPELKVASIAAGGSAAARTFEAFFKKALGAHGDDLEAFGWGADSEPRQLGEGGFGFGYGSDKLVEAAANL